MQIAWNVLDTISSDFPTLLDSNITMRTVSIFNQVSTIWNSNLTKGLAIHYSPQDTPLLFNFADKIFKNLKIIDISAQENVKFQIANGLENILRGSFVNEPNGNTPITYVGSNLTASVTKINVNGFINSTTSTIMSPIGNIL